MGRKRTESNTSRRANSTAPSLRDMGRWLSPPQIARQRGIRAAKVLAWIRSGELEAINLAERRGGRPRWRISPDALARFDATRSSRALLRPLHPRHPPIRTDNVEAYF